MRQVAMALCLVVSVSAVAAAQAQLSARDSSTPPGAAAPALGVAEQERFLLEARIEKVKGVKVGATGTQRATLRDGGVTHDASIQTIDESAARYETAQRVEFNFRDYWGYNVAAYRLGVMLGLDNIPPSVKRHLRGKPAAFTWWVDDIIMDEQARLAGKVTPPDVKYWNAQTLVMRVFDELIANTDRNQGNMLIDRNWKLWMIDHSRAFRLSPTLRNEKLVQRCERTFFARLKALTAATLKAELNDYLTDFEQAAVLKRRDLLVARIESIGPAALYDMPR
jgi:hypothetical protein